MNEIVTLEDSLRRWCAERREEGHPSGDIFIALYDEMRCIEKLDGPFGEPTGRCACGKPLGTA